MLIEAIGEPAVLEHLAEESAELTQAALKLARVIRGENPTPKTLEECRVALTEEWADVVICMGELTSRCWYDDGLFDRIYSEKGKRMEMRLEAAGKTGGMAT